MSYTRELAAAEPAASIRKARAVIGTSRGRDRILSSLSVPWAVACAALMAGSTLLLLPFVLASLRRGRATNRSTAGGGSLTAVKALSGRAVAAACGFGPDTLAPRFRAGLSRDDPPGMSLYGRLYWRSQVLGFRLTHRLWLEQVMSLIGSRISVTTLLQLRTCWLDDVVTRFVGDLQGEPGQLVILGAGYDSRCHRLDLPASVARFEVDAPATQQRKRALLDRLGAARAGTRFVACDFARESWMERAAAAGFDPRVRTCVVWEGVTMYLPEPVAGDVLAGVASLPAGSVVGCDVVDRDWALSAKMQAITRAAGEPWLFGLAAGQERAWIEARGLAVLDELRFEELLQRYMPEDPRGRTLGACGDFGCLLLAGVR